MAKKAPSIQLERAYLKTNPASGYRVLVDRLWPRGVKKETLKLDAWLKEVAPSAELRKWFHADLERWKAFKKKYLAELEAGSEELTDLLNQAKHHKVILVYGARDDEHNHAIILREFLVKLLS